MSTETNNAAPPLAKYLAANDKKVRDKAIKNLAGFLSDSSSDALPRKEMDKLWKGIFYCFWMSDKPLVQQALAAELAELILAITTTEASLRFLHGFWAATVREWNGIDRLRIDKYYMLVRRFVNASFRMLMRASWAQSALEEYNQILSGEGGPLCPSDVRVPAGLSYHLSDVYLEELNKAIQTGKPPHPAPLAPLLNPFFILAAQTPSTVTYQRVESALFGPLFTALTSGPDEDVTSSSKRVRRPVVDELDYPYLIANSCMCDPKTEGQLRSELLKKKMLRVVFDVASRTDTRDANRRKLYNLWKRAADEDGED